MDGVAPRVDILMDWRYNEVIDMWWDDEAQVSMHASPMDGVNRGRVRFDRLAELLQRGIRWDTADLDRHLWKRFHEVFRGRD